MPDFRIGRGEHVLVVGQNQSGKSTLARALTVGYRNQVVIDPKHEETLARAVTVSDARAFAQTYPQRATRVIVRPDPAADLAELDAILQRVRRYGSSAVVVHEAMFYATAATILPELKRIMVAGAGLGIVAWNLTQRPVGVHNVLLSESRHVFVFDLALEDDRRKVAGVVGPGALERPRERFGFGYYGPTTAGLVPCTPLELRRNDPTDDRESGNGHDHGNGRDLPGEDAHPDIPGARPVRPGRRHLAVPVTRPRRTSATGRRGSHH